MATFLTGSYLTNEEYRAAPTALNTQNLVVGPTASQATQDSELAGIIQRASRYLDNVARQPLYATQSTQNDSGVRIKDGAAILHAHQDRVKTLTAFAWGAQFTTLTTLTNPSFFIEENRVRVMLSAAGTVWSGSLNLGQPQWGTIYATWSYVAGWVTTQLTNAQNIGDTIITVNNPAGVVPGLYLRLTAGAIQNTYQVASLTGSVVTLTSPLVETWAAGTGVSEVPEDIKEATILATSHYIKMRAGSGLVMQRTPEVSTADAKELGPELAQATELAERYRRVTP